MRILYLLVLLLAMTGMVMGQSVPDARLSVAFDAVKDPGRLLKTAKTAAERAEMERSYWTMVGALADLGSYRQQFLRGGDFINLFPTAYYHTTLTEMKSIAAGRFVYPIEKLRQMISFYDAYKWNREAWDNQNTGLENHWKQHFTYATQHNDNYIYLANVLSTAIAAHVQGDLARAIRYAYNNRYNKGLLKADQLLLTDFAATDAIFANTKVQTIVDVTGVSPATVKENVEQYLTDGVVKQGNDLFKEYQAYLAPLGFKEAYTDADVIRLRREAWKLGMSDKDIPGLFGWRLLGQPVLDHRALEAAGKTICTSGVPYKSPRDLYRWDTLTFKGDRAAPLVTKLQVQKNEYVYIEVYGKVKVGNYFGEADGAGILEGSLFANSYSKYKGCRLGSVVVMLNDKTESCQRILKDLGGKYSIPGITPDYGVPFVPGYYFIAQEDGVLSFDINDTEPGNNTGSFIINVIRMRYEDHLARNYFNRCPENEPVDEKDCAGNQWEEESIKSWWYHGINDSFRGGKSNAGCQCVYDDDKLITTGDNKGSFDIGYWHFKGDLTIPQAHYYHLVLDVLPHDLFVEAVGEEPDYKFQRSIPCK